MADIVADLLQGPARIDKPLDAGVAKRVGSRTGDENARFQQIGGGATGHGTAA